MWCSSKAKCFPKICEGLGWTPFIKKKMLGPDMMVHAFNPRPWEAEAGGSLSSRSEWSTEWVPRKVSYKPTWLFLKPTATSYPQNVNHYYHTHTNWSIIKAKGKIKSMGAILRRTEIHPVEAEGPHEVGQLSRVEGGFDSQGCLFFMKQQGLSLVPASLRPFSGPRPHLAMPSQVHTSLETYMYFSHIFDWQAKACFLIMLSYIEV